MSEVDRGALLRMFPSWPRVSFHMYSFADRARGLVIDTRGGWTALNECYGEIGVALHTKRTVV